MTEYPLDLDTVQAFIRIAELGSFTRAAEAMRTTQAAVSLKLKRLEWDGYARHLLAWERENTLDV